jgi:hypothetical protein
VASGHKDIESAVAASIGQVELYKVHHHGSATSSNVTLMSTLKPKIATLSVGSPNAFNHPTQSALDRIRASGAVTYWTTPGDGAVPSGSFDVVANGAIRIDVQRRERDLRSVERGSRNPTSRGGPGARIACRRRPAGCRHGRRRLAAAAARNPAPGSTLWHRMPRGACDRRPFRWPARASR